MENIDVSTLDFKVSSFCEAAACVAVATHDGGAAVRDTKQTDGPTLHFDRPAWTAFVADVKAGRHG